MNAGKSLIYKKQVMGDVCSERSGRSGGFETCRVADASFVGSWKGASSDCSRCKHHTCREVLHTGLATEVRDTVLGVKKKGGVHL